jgi:hypothetical protein
MRHLQLAAFALLLSAGLTACAHRGIDWQHHISLRTRGEGLALGKLDPRELIEGKVSRNLHHVGLSLETVFVRDLPGVAAKDHLVLGMEAHGVLPDGRVLKTVADVRPCTDESALVFFENPFSLQPFLYTGQSITVTLSFQAVSAAEASNVRGKMAGGGDQIKKLNPKAGEALETARQLFGSVLGTSTAASRIWKFSFTLHPADGLIRDKPESLLTAARHILLALPPPHGPASLKHLRPELLMEKLKLRGGRVVWEDGREYTDAPYVILNVSRFKRNPATDSELAKVKGQLERALADSNFDRAGGVLSSMDAAIARDEMLSSTEKNLERSWKEFWERHLHAARALQRGEKAAALKSRSRQLRTLLRLKELFRNILEPFELQNIAYQLSNLKDQIEELSREVGESISETVQSALGQDAQREAELSRALDEEAAGLRRRFSGQEQRAQAGENLRVLPGGWVEVVARVEMPPGESIPRARARALAQARQMAVELYSGTGARGRFHRTSQQRGFQDRRVAERLTDLISDALIVAEKVIEEGREDASSGAKVAYRVKLRVQVVRRGARADPGFRVSVALSQRTLRVGDEVEFRVTPTRDAHLYLFSVGPDGDVTVLVPHAFQPSPLVRAGETFVFPGPALRKRIRARARLPVGVSESVEQVKVIALRRDVALLEPPASGDAVFRSSAGSSTILLPSILRRLATLDPDEWAEATIGYTIQGP